MPRRLDFAAKPNQICVAARVEAGVDLDVAIVAEALAATTPALGGEARREVDVHQHVRGQSMPSSRRMMSAPGVRAAPKSSLPTV